MTQRQLSSYPRNVPRWASAALPDREVLEVESNQNPSKQSTFCEKEVVHRYEKDGITSYVNRTYLVRNNREFGLQVDNLLPPRKTNNYRVHHS